MFYNFSDKRTKILVAKTWTVTLEEDGDDLIMPLPDDLMAQLRHDTGLPLNEGDPMWFEVLEDKTVVIHFKEPPDPNLPSSTIDIKKMEA